MYTLDMAFLPSNSEGCRNPAALFYFGLAGVRIAKLSVYDGESLISEKRNLEIIFENWFRFLILIRMHRHISSDNHSNNNRHINTSHGPLNYSEPFAKYGQGQNIAVTHRGQGDETKI